MPQQKQTIDKQQQSILEFQPEPQPIRQYYHHLDCQQQEHRPENPQTIIEAETVASAAIPTARITTTLRHNQPQNQDSHYGRAIEALPKCRYGKNKKQKQTRFNTDFDE